MSVRDTSVVCYEGVVDSGKVSDNCQKVYKYISDNPDLTDTEISRGMGFSDPNKIRPRRKELYDMGLVTETGKRNCSVTGKVAYVWEVRNIVPSDVFVDRKEFPVDGYLEREFKSKTLLELIILVHKYLSKYSSKADGVMLLSAGWKAGVYVAKCKRNEKVKK